MNIIFITAGEIPSISGLHGSQVLEPARVLASRGHRVQWIAAVPILPYMKNLSRNRLQIREARNKCNKFGIDFVSISCWFSLTGILSFPFRKALLKMASSRMSQLISYTEKDINIIHARSYYAAEIAINLKSDAGVDIVASFDMRSILPEEIPLNRGFIGKIYFGFAKQWEYELLLKSDVSFLVVNFARRRIKEETGCDVIYAPLRGFDREANWDANFEERWANKIAGFAGSFSAYQDAKILLEMVYAVPEAIPRFATLQKKLLQGISCNTYKIDQMKGYYESLLFLAVPGIAINDDYFASFKMRCNSFSTKAAEALSCGVPLLVSSALKELSDFVIENDCGLVYDVTKRTIIYPQNPALQEKNFWEALTRNAIRVGKMFEGNNVLSVYENAWRQAADKLHI